MTHNDSIWANTLEQHTDSLNSCIDSLHVKLDALQAKTDLLYGIIETSNDSINNQLAAARWLLGLLALVIAVIGGVLGYYISRKKHEIELMAKTIDEKKDIVSKVAKETEELDNKIHSNLSALYIDLRQEETNALLDRLILEPQDVENLCVILCARDIDNVGYVKLRTAYLKMKKMLEEQTQDNVVRDCSEDYVVLLYQHFFYLALKEEEIAPVFGDYYGDIFNRAYKRDVIKSTIDLCKALSENDISFNKEEVLSTYLKALNASQYKELLELKNIFEQNITPQKLLQNAIAHCTADQVYLTMFGVNPSEGDEATLQQGGTS